MERFLSAYIGFVVRRPAAVAVAVSLVTALAAAWLAVFEPIELDTSFTTLLPDDLPCVVESRRVSKLVGSTDYLIIAIESPDPADNMAFADDIAKKLADFSEVEWVATEEDKSFFRDRRLLYFDLPDLDDVVARAKARLDYEKKIRNPFYVSLDDERPPDISFDDIMEKYKARLNERGAKGVIEKRDPASSKGIDLGDRLASPDGTIMSVLARPSEPATDMAFGRVLVEKAERLIEDTDPHRNPRMTVEVAGPYRNRYREYKQVLGDIFSSLGVSLALILTIVIVFFRRVRTVALIFLPLVVGIVWTVAMTALTLGRLNMTTALIFAVLLGLGIDFGVHMSVRYLDERARGRTLEESLYLALVRTGRAILTAGLTTAGGLAVLILARFKGFSEFGAIATMGIAMCLLTYAIFLPALAALMERVSVPKPWRKKTVEMTRGSARRRPALLGAGLAAVFLVAAAAAFGTTRVEFEYNFRNLRGEKVSSNVSYGKSLGQGSSPVVAVMPTAEDARVLTRHLEAVLDSSHQGLLRKAYSLFSFVPDDQEEKIERLAVLRGYLDEALSLKKLSDDTRERLEEIRVWTEASRIDIENIPDWVKGKFREKDGTLGRMVYLYPWVDEWNVAEFEEFYEQWGRIEVPGKGEVHPSATGFVMVEVVRAVQRDGVLMTVVATAVVLVLLLLDLRSLRRGALVFVPLAVGLLWTGGLMALLGLKLGLYNMLVLPTLLGIGIDSSVHLYHSYREHGRGTIWYSLRTTGIAVLVAAATTGVGFVGMTVVNHDGLKSIGVLAILGISACLAGTLITLPLLLALGEARGRGGGDIE